jgi:polysaccharide pyruvyl transferase WcaK-like protein
VQGAEVHHGTMPPKRRESEFQSCTDGMQLSVQHVASFHGNVGDNASHNGLYASFFKSTGYRLKPEAVEIRRGYQSYAGPDRLDWLREVIENQSDYQLTLVGGGNFFTPRIDHSPSGTTIGIGADEIRGVSRPLVFHGIGFDLYQGTTERNLARFRQFLEQAAANPHVDVYFRNDGSLKNLRSCYGDAVAERARVVPDPGFFVDVGDAVPGGGLGFERYLAVNVAKDMLEMRFDSQNGYRDFVSGMAEFLEKICAQEELALVLVPHIWSDVEAAGDLLGVMRDRFRRTRVAIAPLLTGPGSEKCVFGIYRDAEVVIGNRFHTNVCSIGMGVPTVGVASYQKLTDLYAELGIPNRCISTSREDLWGSLSDLTVDTLKQKTGIVSQYRQIREMLLSKAQEVHAEILRLGLRGSGAEKSID